MDPVPSRALAVARRHRGLVLRDDLVERAGVSQSSIRRYLRRGDWIERLPGVIDLRTHEEGWRHDLTALAMAAGPDAWASHGSAAYLHRFLDAELPSRPHIQMPRGRHAVVAGVRLHTTRSIGRDEVTQVGGLPCTTRARTLLDLAADTSPERLERYLANLARRSPNVVERVATLTDRHRHAPGRQRLLCVVRRLPGDVARLGSPLEVIGVQRLLQLGAPAFVLQYPARTWTAR